MQLFASTPKTTARFATAVLFLAVAGLHALNQNFRQAAFWACLAAVFGLVVVLRGRKSHPLAYVAWAFVALALTIMAQQVRADWTASRARPATHAPRR